MEDEGYLASDNIFLRDNNSIIFNRADGSHNISSSGISQVDFNFEFANIAFNSNNPVKFNTAVNITGNLEVGGTFNLEDLTVNDLIQAERIIIATDENTILFADDSFGVTRFGVGTKTPVRTLDVNGTADIYEDLYVQDDIILTDDMTLGGDIISAGSYRTNNTVALQFDTLQSEWAFAYNGALTGGTNTGLYFDAVGGEVGFKYLNNYIWKTSLLGTTTTHGIGFDADMVFSPTGTNTGSFKWWEDEDYFKTPNNWIFDENITVGSGSSYVNYGVCYYTSGQLGHCSTTMNATGGCTCVAN